MNLTIQIGGYRVQIDEPKNYSCLVWPLRPFDHFLAPSTLDSDLHIEVTVVSPLPDLEPASLLFDSAHGCWTLSESDAGLLFESLDPKNFQPRVRASVSKDYRTVQAWILPSLEGGQVGWSPMHLFNPLIEVCLLSRIARDGGLLLHAAGLVLSKEGFVFTGPSEAGKSTISELFARQGATVLSDERVILRQQGSTFFLYGTPWVGSGQYAENGSAPMTALYRISHGAEHHGLTPLTASRAVTLLLQQAFLPHWDRNGMERTLEFLESLTARIPCQSLSFLNQPDVVEFVREHSSVLTVEST